MYDAKKFEDKKEKCSKCNCIADRAYYNKDSRNVMLSTKTSYIPTENIFY